MSTLSSTIANSIGFAIQSAGATLSAPGTIAEFSSSAYDATNALQAAQGRADPLMSFCWFAQMPVVTPNQAQNPGVLGAVSAGLQSAANSALSSLLGNAAGTAISGAAQLPWQYVEEATLPFRNFEQRSIFREGRSRHYPDKYSVDNMRCIVYADSANVAMNYLMTWQNAVMKPFTVQQANTGAGGYGRPSEYKLPIQFYVLDVTNQEILSVEYTECWPLTVDAIQLDSGTSNRIRLEVNFSVGDVFFTQIPVGGLQTVAQVLSNPSSFPAVAGGILSGV